MKLYLTILIQTNFFCKVWHWYR